MHRDRGVSLLLADIRFLLPSVPRTAWVSPALEPIQRACEQAGLTLDGGRPDVAILTPADTRAARDVTAPARLVIGRGRARPEHAGTAVRRFLALPRPLDPHVIVPVDRPAVASYGIDTWTGADSSLRRTRNLAAATAIRLGTFPDISRSVRLFSATAGAPFIVAAASDLGVPPAADWFLILGLGDALTRAVFQLFAPGEHNPRWALKFSRVPGHLAPFERDEEGLRLAASIPAAAAHAPRLLGRFEAGGHPASVEEAVSGRLLTYLLQRRGSKTEKLRVIDAVAAWIVDVGSATAAPSARLQAERRRLEADILPLWRDHVPSDLLERVSEVPAVMQHNDLATHNVIVGEGGFTAVDWESARAHGFPLWDLMYFLLDALVHLDRAWAGQARQDHALRVLRGETQSSAVLFRWLHAAVKSLGLPEDAVGATVTLGWLDHSITSSKRKGRVKLPASGRDSNAAYSEWMARRWLTTPGLGSDWSAWRR